MTRVNQLPALFSVPIWMTFCTFRYLFRLWDMQSEAFRFDKSFEHSPKPPTPKSYKVFNVKNRHLQQQISKHNFGRSYPAPKKNRRIHWCSPFRMQPSKI